MLHFYYSIKSEKEMNFINSKGEFFEWKSFENETLSEDPKKAIKDKNI